MEKRNRYVVRDVIEEVRQGIGSPDSKLTDDHALPARFVYFKILHNRAMLIDRRMRGKGSIAENLYYPLPCVFLEVLDENLCPCVPASGCMFSRSIEVLPLPVGKIKSVTNTTGREHFSYVSYDKVSLQVNSPIKGVSEAPFYTYRRDEHGLRLYLYGKSALFRDVVSVKYIPYDPVASFMFKGCKEEDSSCFSFLDADFLTDPSIQSDLVNLTVQQLKIEKSGLRPDLKDDKLDQVFQQNVKEDS